MDRVYFVNSGTEAIEASMKIAKKYTGRSQFVSFKNSYHGSTHGSLSIQGSDKYKGGYYPLLPDTMQANFNDFAVLEQITAKTAGVVIECIQAGSGYIPADPAWIKAVRARCREVGALMILDEIQTGMGQNWAMVCALGLWLLSRYHVFSESLWWRFTSWRFCSS
jgi:acetylornithine/succinyldiaminopimelate/putrescine aminotransferase